ncbi:MAG: aminoglycoside phosphotransferase family protein, partial [Pseudonocardiaceae bacterium]
SMRPEERESAERSLRVARWLDRNRVPVAPPWRDGPLDPFVVRGQAVTFWEEMGRSRPSKAKFGEALRQVHSHTFVPVGLRLPTFDPVKLAAWATRAAPGILSTEQEAFARARLGELGEQYKELRFALPPGIIHGDSHVANALTRPGPRNDAVISDWDFASVGPREWDLIPTALEQFRMGAPKTDQEKFARA